MLGDLSARFESGRKGTDAIGWDSRGGLSLGKYQIAYKPGTLAKFLEWCQSSYPALYRALDPLYGTITDGSESKRCQFAMKWKELAAGSRLPEAEHQFIKESHFGYAFRILPDQIQVFVAASMALQQVLWSTAVQHGPSGAKKIFIRSWVEAIDRAQFIRNIYARRATKFGKHNAKVQAAVRQRFRVEMRDALKMLADERREHGDKEAGRS